MTTSRSNTNTDTGSGSGEEDTTTKGRSTSRGTKTDKSTGDSSSAAVLDIADDIEFIPRALVEDIFELNGAFEYGKLKCVCINDIRTVENLILNKGNLSVKDTKSWFFPFTKKVTE